MISNKLQDLVSTFADKEINIEHSKLIISNIVSLLKNETIVIWGAGIAGKFYGQLFQSLNIEIECFIDQNAKNIKSILNVPVYSYQHLLKKNNKKYLIIIAGNPSTIFAIKNVAEKLDLTNADIFGGDVLLEIIQNAVCMTEVEENKGLDLAKCSVCIKQEGECSAFKTQIEKLSGNKPDNSIKKNGFDMVGIILGQVCTLRCKHCCESIPYIKQPEIVEASIIIKDIQKLARATPFLHRVEFIGGEPFLHKELPEIVEAVLNINNVGYIVIFTNGTVMPKENLSKVLKNPRVIVAFSGYKDSLSNKLQQKITNTKDKLNQLEIGYSIFNPDARSWFDFNYYQERKVTPQELEEYFENCFINECHRLFNGGLYRCPHQYSGIQLGEIEKYPIEYIDIHAYSDEELNEQLKKFGELKYTNACRFCNMPYDAPEVIPAIQL